MKKTMILIVVFALLLTLGSAATDSIVDGKAGYRAPMFKVERNDSVVALDNLKGEWVLVQFWSSSDASSRISCKEYTKIGEKLFDSTKKEKIHFLAVNFDRNERLFNEIVRRDGLDAKSQFFVEGSKANLLIKDYHLESGMSAYLIDPSGRVVAKNPTEQRLIEIASN